MSRRRKRILIAALGVVLAVLVWMLLPGRGRMDVKLVFLGYTNAMLTNYVMQTGTVLTNALQVQQAMVMLTNIGEAPVRISFMRSPTPRVFMGAEVNIERQIWFPSPAGKPNETLAPGVGMVLLSQPTSFSLPWTVEMQVWRNCPQDRLYWLRLGPQAIQRML